SHPYTNYIYFFLLIIPRPPRSTLFPFTTLFRSTFSPDLETKFEKMLQAYPQGRTRSAVVPMLIYAQDEVGHISEELIEEVARRCNCRPLQVDEVVGYYSMLHRTPMGKYHVQVCTNISCLILGGEELLD